MHTWKKCCAMFAVLFLAGLLLPACGKTGGRGKSTYDSPLVKVATPDDVQSGDVEITYTFLSTEDNAYDISVSFSIDGGATFQPAAQGTGGNGTSDLSSSPYPGDEHTFVWDSFADGVAENAAVETCVILISPVAAGGTPGKTDYFTVDNSGPPSKAANPNPANEAEGVPVTSSIFWTAASGATSYDVYFDTTTPPGLVCSGYTATTYPPGLLEYETTYYWRVDSVNAAGNTTGDLWSFVTEAEPTSLPDKVTGPTPNDEAVNVLINQVLGWLAATGATSYQVYLGTDESAVTSATPASPEHKEETSGLSYDTAGLAPSTTYYWRVDSVNGVGTTKGDTWTFTTAVPPPVADFAADPVSGTAPLEVTFTDSSSGAVTSYEWDFDNNGTTDSTDENPTHVYDDPGLYTVVLTVSGPGGQDTKTRPDYITVVESLSIVTLRLPYARKGVQYNETLAVAGGVAPYDWQVIGGDLPNGLTLDDATGVIFGRPSSGYSGSSFIVSVTDSNSDCATQILAIDVDPNRTAYIKVRKDGGGDYENVTDALNSLPDPLTSNVAIEIADDETYNENLVISVNTVTYHLFLRSSYKTLATIQAADADAHTILLNYQRMTVARLRICGASGAGKAGVKFGNFNFLNVKNCVLYNNDIAVDAGDNPGITVVANTCYGPKGIISSGGGSATVANNIIYATGDWCIYSTICESDYNLLYAPSGNIGYDGSNYFTTLADWQGAWHDPNSRSGDPNFLDLGGEDFHLTAASTEAIDRGNKSFGSMAYTLVLDAEGYARQPQDDLMDIGAYEHR